MPGLNEVGGIFDQAARARCVRAGGLTPTGSHIPAQGNALGGAQEVILALKGRDRSRHRQRMSFNADPKRGSAGLSVHGVARRGLNFRRDQV